MCHPETAAPVQAISLIHHERKGKAPPVVKHAEMHLLPAPALHLPLIRVPKCAKLVPPSIFSTLQTTKDPSKNPADKAEIQLNISNVIFPSSSIKEGRYPC